MTFLGDTAPTGDPFYGMNSTLETVYVPAEGYSSYSSVFRSYLPVGTRLFIQGAESDFIIEDGVLVGYLGDGGEVEIPAGVTVIGVNAFRGCTDLTVITMPDSVKEIRNHAFFGCTQLSSIRFSNNLTSIGESAFYQCKSLTVLNLPDTLVSIGNYAFYECTSLHSINPIVTSSDHMYRCYNVGSITWEDAKRRCEAMGGYLATVTSQEEQDLVQSIVSNGGYAAWLGGYYENGAWHWLSGEEFSYTNWDEGTPSNPQSEPYLGIYANDTESTYATTGKWNDCSGNSYTLRLFACEWDHTKENTLPSSLETIGNSAFYGCTGLSGSLTVPSSVKSIGSSAFYNCYGFYGELRIEDGGEAAIDSSAFRYCNGFSGLALGDGIKSIGSYAFSGCSGMKGDLIIPDSVTSIGSYAFSGCSGFDGRLVLSESLTSIPYQAFANCSGIQGELVIPNGVTVVYYQAFYNMSGITSVVIGENVTRFAYSGSSDTYYYVTFPSSVKKMTFLGDTAPAGNPFYGMNSTLEAVFVPSDRYEVYASVYKTYLPVGARLTIEGAVGDYLIDDDILLAYLGNGGEITIPDGIRHIGVGAFQNCVTLTKVTMPDSVVAINERAFNGCTGLLSVVFSDNLVTIGQYAFRGCGALKEIALPESLITIDNYAFADCASISSLILPSSLDLIGQYAFQNCRGIKGGLTIPASVTVIGHYAFNECRGFDGKLTIRESGGMIIGNCAFRNCVGFTSLEIGYGVTNIGSEAFAYCAGFKGNLVIPNSVTTMGNSAFSGCSGFDGTLTLSESLTQISYGVFYNCSRIKGELFIPDQVTAVYYYAFFGMNSITSVVVGKSVTRFLYSSSTNNTSYNTFPTTVNRITFKGSKIPSGNPLYGMGTALETVYVPASNLEAYINAYRNYLPVNARFEVSDGEREFLIDGDELIAYLGFGGEVTIPDGIRVIGPAAFQNCATLTKITMPDSVTTVSASAFAGCRGLVSVVFSEQLVSIKEKAFMNCVSLASPDLPDSLETIGLNAFSECTAIKALILPPNLKTIGQQAFYNCRGIKGSLTIPSSVTTIGHSAFQGCSGFDGMLVIEETDDLIIGNNAFYSCSGFTGLELGYGVREIGQYAFYRCTGMTGDLAIPNSVSSIGSYAFYQCNGFDGTLTLSENLSVISSYAFSNCTKITGELVIPDKVTEIQDRAFQNLLSLTSIVIGTGVTSVYLPFIDCRAVQEISFAGTRIPTGNPFNAVDGALRYVYVPMEKYDRFVEAYSGFVGANVQFVTDLMKARVKNLAVSHLYSQTVVLTWAPHVCEDVIGYVVKRDGITVADVTTLSFADRNLETGTEYVYTVYGYTADGRTTAENTVTVSPTAPTIRDIKTDNAYNKVGLSNGTIYIYVRNNKNLKPYGDVETVGKLFYLDGEHRILIGQAAMVPTMSSSETAVYAVEWDITDIEDGEYSVLFVLEDVDGGTAEYRENLTVDRSVPDPIINVYAVSDVNVIYVNWAIATEIDTIYRIYRRDSDSEEFELIAQITDRNTLSYVDKKVESDKIYYYYVVGVNDFGQEGEPSSIAAATLTPDTEAPLITLLQPTNESYLTGTVTVGLTSQDNLAVVRSELYYSTDNGETWILLTESNLGVFTWRFDTTALPDGKIKLKGVAYDAAENPSEPLIYVFCIDNTGPEQIQGLEATSTSVTVTLSWEDVTDEDIRFFRVEIKNGDGTYTQVTDVYRTLGVNLMQLSPDTSYTYRVVGYDIHGNRGTPSDDITVRTESDTNPPVVTKIRPTSGHFADKIPVSVTAADEYNVYKIEIQVSSDRDSWTTVYTQTNHSIAKTRSVSFDLALNPYEEGYIYVRAIATDSAGNQSVSDVSAPFVQHVIDRTAPDRPENVTATGYNGYIELRWDQGSETDLRYYSVYRSNQENGTYVLIAANVSALNYFDRNVTAGMTYYYKVTVTDLSGNSSVFSDSVNASVAVDAEKPVIHSVYPSVDNMIGVGLKTVSVLVSDNNELSFILIEYSVNGSAFSTLKLFESINSYNKTVSADLDTSVLTDGDRVSVRVTVQDMSGNQTVSDPVTYTVDLSAPAVPSVTSVFNGSCVEIQWSGLDEEDLAGYRIYRKVLGSSSFNLIAQKQAVAGQTVYSLSDVSLDKVAVTYVYQIAAIDKWGNVSYAETRIELGDRSFPVGVISCESVFEIGVEYVVDASLSTDNSHIVSYLIDFGDGVTTADRKAIHKYTAIGTYTITLTVTDDSGNVTVTTKEVTVKERTLIGSVRIRVIDENGKAVPGASVYFDLGEDTQVIKQTDHQGYASFTADVGKHAVGCIIPNNEWLPAKKEVVVTAGNVTTVTMTMVHHTLVEGHFEIHRMTFEEIIAAGIDVSNPENQHYVKVMVHLVYEATTVSTPIYVNPITHEQKSSPIVVDERVYYPQVVYPNGGGGGGGGGLGGGYHFSYEPTVILFELPVEVSCLKEFFDVKLHIINNASDEFSMLDNVITLNVPDGLTLMDTNVSSGSSVVKISEIKGQTTETIRWILRGDEVGEYYLTADYSGILSQFNAPITTRFVAEDPIEVYGLSNLKLLVEVAETLDHGTLYYNCALINEGWLDVYLPGIDTPDELIEIELLDDRGRRLLESMGLTAKDFIAKDDQGITIEEWVTTLSGDPGVLKPGYALRKHYMCINQSSYTEKEYKLKGYWYEIQNSYGLEVEIVVKPLAYFKGYLNSEVNPVEKAENVLGIHKNLYDYLMDSQNFTYWAFYSSNGALNSELPSKAETMIWEMMKLDFVEMITDEESEELIKALILDTMELTLETTSDYSTYLNAANFLKKVTDFAEKAKLDELLGEGFEFIGKHIPRCFDFMFTYSKWEFYQSVTAMYGDSERFFYYQWSQYVKVESLEISISETEFSKIIHKIFSAEGFEAVWEGLCKAPDVIKDVVKICKNVEMDIALFIAAQSNIDNCNLFLDAVIACAPASQAVHNSMLEYVGEAFLIAAVPWAGIPAQIINQTYIQVVYGDADKVVRCAKEIKENINNGSVLRSLLDNLLEDQLDTFVDEVIGQSVKAAAKFAGLVGSGWVTALKVGLKLVTFIGDNVFNVSERHDIADNIRYISILTLAMQTAIHQAETTYREDPSSVTSQKFMQLLYYLINIRQIGESQVAELGVSYEVLPVKFPEGYHNPWNSEDLFKQVCSVSHVSGVDSWYEWRDVVEDELSLLRVDLFRNPVTTEVTGLKAPVVTFDYARGETVQTFSDEYQYSVDGGTTWHPCDGNAIKINPGSAVTTLMVQRVDRTNTDQTGTGYCTVYGIPSLMSSGIVAVENAFGYLIDHLDNRKQYEITFSKTPLEYEYGDSLSMRIPAGSYSFLYHTDEDYDYVYICALSDANSYASYTLESAIVKYESTWDVNTEDRKITNLTSTSKDEFLDYCDKLGSHVTVTDPSGETGDSIGTGHQLSVDDQIYDIVVSADVNGDAVIDMSDLELMLAHMNGIEELAGLLLEAGCLSGGEDIDIFDVFEALELVLANQATE